MMLCLRSPRGSFLFSVILVSLLGCGASSPSMLSAGGSSGTAGTSAAGGSNGSGTGGAPGKTSLTGTLSTLGALQPTVSSLWISNSGETLIYMSSAAITCNQLTVSRWLGSTTADSQVVEIVIQGAPKVADYPVPPNEVNYASGGKSSSYEVNADSGKISFTAIDAQVVEGTVTATYGSKSLSGTFHAEFCANGQGY
jgi:hypothetical protein